MYRQHGSPSTCAAILRKIGAIISHDSRDPPGISEAYAILKDVLGMDAAQLADTFAEWNKGELESYLIEITSEIFRKIDPETGKPLVDMILDKAGQKGTGIWTLQAAIRQYVVISTINAAVEARVISSRKDERVAASKILPQPKARKFKAD